MCVSVCPAWCTHKALGPSTLMRTCALLLATPSTWKELSSLPLPPRDSPSVLMARHSAPLIMHPSTPVARTHTPAVDGESSRAGMTFGDQSRP